MLQKTTLSLDATFSKDFLYSLVTPHNEAAQNDVVITKHYFCSGGGGGDDE
jgi:hypothetical protein